MQNCVAQQVRNAAGVSVAMNQTLIGAGLEAEVQACLDLLDFVVFEVMENVPHTLYKENNND